VRGLAHGRDHRLGGGLYPFFGDGRANRFTSAHRLGLQGTSVQSFEAAWISDPVEALCEALVELLAQPL